MKPFGPASNPQPTPSPSKQWDYILQAIPPII